MSELNNKKIFEVKNKSNSNNNNSNNNIDIPSGCFFYFIAIIIFLVLIPIISFIVSCSETESVYPNFDESHYISIAQNKVKSKLNYPSTAEFSYCEAKPYEENGIVYVMATGKVEAKNAFGLKLAYQFYVKFKIDLEANTYEVYEPIITEW